MSLNSGEFGRDFGLAWSAAQKQGAVGGSGSGGRRGGGGDGGIRKERSSRCYKCGSSEHLVADCPYRHESRREVRRRLQEAHPDQQALPAPTEQPALPPTSPPPTVAAGPDPATPAERPVYPLVWERTIGHYLYVPSTHPPQSDTPSAPAFALAPPPPAPLVPTSQPTVSYLVWPRTTPEQQTIIQYAVPQNEPRLPPPPAPEPQTGRPPARLGWSVHWSEISSRWYYRKFLDGMVSWEEPRETD